MGARAPALAHWLAGLDAGALSGETTANGRGLPFLDAPPAFLLQPEGLEVRGAWCCLHSGCACVLSTPSPGSGGTMVASRQRQLLKLYTSL